MTALYTQDILTLAVSLADYPLSDDLPLQAEARSRSCGSTVKIGLALDEEGHVQRCGALVSACAIGQAASALCFAGLQGKHAAAIASTQAEIKAWLANADVPTPDWPGLARLEAARSYPGRHGAILLPWTAALEALSSKAEAG